MCFESMDSKLDSILEVDIGGDELVLGLTSAFYHLLVFSAGFIFHDLEVYVVAAACYPFHDEAVRRYAVFVSAHF